jgi:hypothetical protein
MKVFKVVINGETFKVLSKEIFTASKQAIDLYHKKRKDELGVRRRIPNHIDLQITSYCDAD